MKKTTSLLFPLACLGILGIVVGANASKKSFSIFGEDDPSAGIIDITFEASDFPSKASGITSGTIIKNGVSFVYSKVTNNNGMIELDSGATFTNSQSTDLAVEGVANIGNGFRQIAFKWFNGTSTLLMPSFSVKPKSWADWKNLSCHSSTPDFDYFGTRSKNSPISIKDLDLQVMSGVIDVKEISLSYDCRPSLPETSIQADALGEGTSSQIKVSAAISDVTQEETELSSSNMRLFYKNDVYAPASFKYIKSSGLEFTLETEAQDLDVFVIKKDSNFDIEGKRYRFAKDASLIYSSIDSRWHLEENVADLACDFYSADSTDFKLMSEQENNNYKTILCVEKGHNLAYSLGVNNKGSGPYNRSKSLQPIVLDHYDELRFAIASRSCKLTLKDIYQDAEVVSEIGSDALEQPVWSEVVLRRENEAYSIYVDGVKKTKTLPLDGSLADLYIKPNHGWGCAFVSNILGISRESSITYQKVASNPFTALNGVADGSVAVPLSGTTLVNRFDSANWTSNGYQLANVDLTGRTELIFKVRYVNDDTMACFGYHNGTGLDEFFESGGHWYLIRLSKSAGKWAFSMGSVCVGKNREAANMNEFRFTPVNGPYPFYCSEVLAR